MKPNHSAHDSNASFGSDGAPSSERRQVSVLHVGGVGTNALINAGLLNETGYLCHVAANDIYHCICSPEWQELSNKGLKREDLGDDFFPNFFRIEESASVRPRWFAQGPQLLTITYLHSLKNEDKAASDILWRTLQYNRFKAVLHRTTVPGAIRLDEKRFRAALRDLSVAPVFREELRQGFMADKLIRKFATLAARLNGNIDPKLLIPPFATSYIDAIVAYDDRLAAEISSCRAAGLSVLIGLEERDWRASPNVRKQQRRLGKNGVGQRRRDLAVQETAIFDSVMPAWNSLMGLYDHRMMYGGSAVIGLLSDAPDYMAYEHGTIRSIPFENNPLGRLTKSAYERADAVFLTNTDYATASPRLEFSPEQRTYIPHAFDERPLLAFADKHRSTRRPGPIRLFGPARQDWVLNDPARSKANHLVVKAAHELLRTEETNFKITFVAWGDDVAATKVLIAELGLDQHFEWVEPMARQALWMRYIDSDAVLDQFLISGLSGVTYETLALGCRTITKDDGICNKEFFGVPPPFLAAGTAAEIAQRIRELMADAEDAAGVGNRGTDWVRTYHSGARFVALQKTQFERVQNISHAALDAETDTDEIEYPKPSQNNRYYSKRKYALKTLIDNRLMAWPGLHHLVAQSASAVRGLHRRVRSKIVYRRSADK